MVDLLQYLLYKKKYNSYLPPYIEQLLSYRMENIPNTIEFHWDELMYEYNWLGTIFVKDIQLKLLCISNLCNLFPSCKRIIILLPQLFIMTNEFCESLLTDLTQIQNEVSLEFQWESSSVIKESEYALKRLDDVFKILNVSVSVNNTSITIFIPSTNSTDQKVKDVSSTTNVTQAKTSTMNTSEQKKQSQYQPEDPDCIEFWWGYKRLQEIKPREENSDQKSCDTFHTLYLLQCAIQEMNDESVNNLDCAEVITNFLEWHNENKWENKFDGKLLDETDSSIVIRDMLNKIGGIPLIAAEQVYHRLKGVKIKDEWLSTPINGKHTLKLRTHGYWKIYRNEKIFLECTTEEMIALLCLVVVPDFNEELRLGKSSRAKGFASVDVDDWEDKFIQYFRDNHLNGQRFMESINLSFETLGKNIMDHLINPNILNEKGKRLQIGLRGGVTFMLGNVRDLSYNNGKVTEVFSRKLIVHGYLREFEQKYALTYRIPEGIKTLVSMYYHGF
eukprot:496885_1